MYLLRSAAMHPSSSVTPEQYTGPVSIFARKLAVWRLLAAHRGGLRLKELSERVAVSKLTVQRDIDDLSRAGVPVEEQQVGQAIVYLLRDPGPAPAGLTFGETAALDAAHATLAPFRGSSFAKDIETVRAKSKVTATLKNQPPPFQGSQVRGARAPEPAVLTGLLEGILLSRRCMMIYRSRSSTSDGEYLVEPYRFRLLDGIIYLDARVPPHAGFRTFGAHLVRDVRLLDEEFKRPRRLPRNGFGVFEGKAEQVEVRFHADIAPFIAERQWHPTQKLRTEPDGTLVFTAKLSGMYEFVGWVMSWGPRAELVRPAAWRAEVRRRLESMTNLYAARLAQAVPIPEALTP